ncbi:tyrosine-type recombinase/integrase [Dysosmobacter sp.]|uniref:tyrosine-type recombinase/integrase n=1 Tax=Dysosmobacter sp. TaxID=2591382 RepID=UPI003AB85491
MGSTRSMQELTNDFNQALVIAGYSESRLTNFRTIIKRLLLFGAEQGIECYSSSVGKKFLEKYYPVEFDGRLVHDLPCTTQYAWRTIALLDDFNTHGAFFRARRLRGNLQLTPEFQDLSGKFGDYSRSKGTSEATIYRRQSDLRKFFNYLHSNEISVSEISHKTVVGFLGTIITLSDATVEHHRRTISLFLQFLFQNGYVDEDHSCNMPAKRCLRKNSLPSVWEREDVDKLLSAVDRGNPIGKRDYAILLLVTKLGLRTGDIRTLCLSDIDWETGRLSFVQSKTQKRVDLPMPNDVGWAIIDYLKHGRPKTEIQNIRNSKFSKERLVPMSKSLIHYCSEYVSKVCEGRDAKAPFFQTPKGEYYRPNTILYAWRQLLHYARISYGGKGKGPRIHDLRHTFAVHCLQKWVESGEDLNAKLPYLSAYMGHVGLSSTQQYLRLTAESFPHVTSAFENSFDVFPRK